MRLCLCPCYRTGRVAQYSLWIISALFIVITRYVPTFSTVHIPNEEWGRALCIYELNAHELLNPFGLRVGLQLSAIVFPLKPSSVQSCAVHKYECETYLLHFSTFVRSSKCTTTCTACFTCMFDDDSEFVMQSFWIHTYAIIYDAERGVHIRSVQCVRRNEAGGSLCRTQQHTAMLGYSCARTMSSCEYKSVGTDHQ